MDIKTLRGLLMGMFGVIVVLLVLVAVLLVRDMRRSTEPEAENVAVATSSVETVAEAATVVDVVTPTTRPNETTTLPPPLVQELPTNTPLPTDTATNTPVSTETPLPTDTAVPSATFVPPTNPPPLPTAVPPTATFTPVPPTATPSGPQPTVANGLQGGGFELQEWRTSLTPGGAIWYEWTVINTTSSDVPYSTIGVMPRRNGQDVIAWYQNNWGGNNDAMPAGSTLTWPSWLSIPEAGDFTLRVVVCFDGYQACTSGGGTFYTLSQEITVSIR